MKETLSSLFLITNNQTNKSDVANKFLLCDKFVRTLWLVKVFLSISENEDENILCYYSDSFCVSFPGFVHLVSKIGEGPDLGIFMSDFDYKRSPCDSSKQRS